MSKVSVSSRATVFAGIDVSAATLAAAVQREDREGFEQREFANSAAGHRQMLAWLLKRGSQVRVSLEATGIYSLGGLNKRIARLRKEAVALVEQDAELKTKFQRLIGIPGIAETSAVHLLGELAGLDPEMTVRQWVAHSGLDPAHRISGSSVHLPSRISRHGNRHLRRALYMPALVAVRFDPHLKAFYPTLQARHKTKLQALMAVARH